MKVLLGALLATAWSITQVLAVQTSAIQKDKAGCSPPEHAVVGSVLLDGKFSDGNPKFKFVAGVDNGAVAQGVYVDSRYTPSNFGKLRISTQPGFPDEVQLAAAGFLEAWLTAERIYDHYVNVKHYFETQLYPNISMDRPYTWLHQQEAWIRSQVADNTDDPVWRTVGLLMAQFEGMWQGYRARHAQEQRLRAARRGALGGTDSDEAVGELTRDDISFMNNNGELYDIIDHFGINDAKEAAAKTRAQQKLTLGGTKAGQQYKQQYRRLDSKGAAGQSATGSAASKRGGRMPKRSWRSWEQQRPDPQELLRDIALSGKCSALIKVAGDLSDIFIGHSTWDSFTSALRIYKMYELGGLGDEAVLARKISFSSYPGELFSDDDFYITDTGLVVVETTNHVFNPEVLLESLLPQALPSWVRVRAALMLANSGQDWVAVFKSHNSGTYNNQYMVVDLKKFIPKVEMQQGLLWIAEQIPGTVFAADMTDDLARGYWPSYNVPFFEAIYNATGYDDLVRKYNKEDAKEFGLPVQWLKYQVAPRANIFRRDHASVTGLEQMRAIMRYNSYRNDSYSLGNPLAAICGRGDLNGKLALPKGCYDSKITNYGLAMQMQAEVVNGPTPTSAGVPFQWEAKWEAFRHRGHPQVFNFTYERMAASSLPICA